MVLAWSILAFGLLEGSHIQRATHLGHTGATVRVIVVPDAYYTGPERLTMALIRFAAEHEVSVAFAQSYDTGLVTVLDEHDRFHNSEGSLGALLDAPGSGRSAAFATAIEGSVGSWAGRHLPAEVEFAGTFRSDVTFEERYPMLLLSPEARPFDTGVYLFASNDATRDGDALSSEVVRFFEAQWMNVVDAMPLSDASIRTLLARNMAQPYGVIALMFFGIVALAQLVVMRIHAALFRERLFVAAVLGAAKRQLRRIVAQRLLQLVAAGLIMGTALSLLVVVASQGLALAEPGPRVAVIALALAVSALTSMLMCAFVAWREARKVARAVPC